MKFKDIGAEPEIENTDTLIADSGEVRVYKDIYNSYHIVVKGVVRHPHCHAEDVIRAMSHYLFLESF